MKIFSNAGDACIDYFGKCTHACPESIGYAIISEDCSLHGLLCCIPKNEALTTKKEDAPTTNSEITTHEQTTKRYIKGPKYVPTKGPAVVDPNKNRPDHDTYNQKIFIDP